MFTVRAHSNGDDVAGLRMQAADGYTQLSDESGVWLLPDRLDGVEVAVVDRDGRVIDRIVATAGRLELDAIRLSSHLGRPLHASQVSSGRSSRQQARALLAGAPGSARSLLDRLCDPWLDRLPGLVEGVFDVQRRDPDALVRARDAFDNALKFRFDRGGFPAGDAVASASSDDPPFGLGELRDDTHAIGAGAGSDASDDPVGETVMLAAALSAVRPGLGEAGLATFAAIVRSVERYDRIIDDFQQGRLNAQRAEQHALNLWLDCGPDEGPLPPEPPGDDPFHDAERFDRGRCAVEAYREIERLTREYSIDELQPVDACASETLTIRGAGFGPTAGIVVIGARRIVADTWTDSEITVTLPADVRSGPVTLDVVVTTVFVCDRLIDVKARASSAPLRFTGGLPTASISVSNRRALPGETVRVSWSALDAERVRVTGGGLAGPAFRSGTRFIALPNATSTQTIDFTVEATNRCGTSTVSTSVVVHRPATAWVHKVEVTQGVQVLDAGQPAHLVGTTFAASPDNSVQLIARKRTMARVHLESDQDPGFNAGIVPDVDVSLFAYRDGVRPGRLVGRTSRPVINLSPVLVETRRFANPSAAVNFEIPADLVDGATDVEFRAFASVPGTAPDSIDRSRREATTGTLTFRNAGTPRFVLVRVNVTNPAHPLPPPAFGTPLEQTTLFNQIARIRARLPFADFRLELPEPRDQILNFGGRLDRATSLTGCDDAWPQLLDALEDLEKDYDDVGGTIWLGLLSGVPAGARTIGCGNTSSSARGTAAFPITLPNAAAHEIGHTFGISHLNQANPDGAAFPNYGYPPGPPPGQFVSIGEYGVDVDQFHTDGSLILFSPNSTTDYMNSAVGPNQWTSPYMWQRYRLGGLSGGAGAATIDQSTDEPRDMMHVFGRIELPSGRVKLRRLYHLPRRSIGPGRKYDSGYRIVLLDAGGDVIVESPVTSRSETPRAPLRISEMIPFDDEAVALEVRSPNGDVLCRRERPDQPVQISDVAVIQRDDDVEVSWSADGRYVYGLAASRDGGTSWWRIVKGARSSPLRLTTDEIGAGRKILLRLIATNGFDTEHRDVGPIDGGPIALLGATIADVQATSNGTHVRADVALPFGVDDDSVDRSVAWYADGQVVGRGVATTIDSLVDPATLDLVLTDPDGVSNA